MQLYWIIVWGATTAVIVYLLGQIIDVLEEINDKLK